MPSHEHIKNLTSRIAARRAGAGDHPVRQLAARDGFLYVPLKLIRPNPDQPRTHFDRRSLDDLTASVKEKGVLQPILIRQDEGGDGFTLIDGERRWRAATTAGLKEIPALVRKEVDALEVALIANVQRQNLTALEESEALARLQKARGFSHDALAKIIGKSRVSVTESLSLNQLPEAIKTTCRTSDMWSKSQLLQVLRAGSPEKIEEAFHALETGQTPTVRELRKKTKKVKAAQRGRPKHAHFEWAPDDGKFEVTVTFHKKSASRAELRDALKAALKHLPELHA